MDKHILDLTKSLPNLTPRQIVDELDRYIIGQHKAKRACAIALRNRRRRQNVAPELVDEILPKNILMIGSTGVGKTEIARRLAKLAHSPFIKVEASKFTEVGYVGRDVESMVRDLVEISINMVKEEQATLVRTQAKDLAIERILDLYHPPLRPAANLSDDERDAIEQRHLSHRDRLREKLLAGELDEEKVELEVSETNMPSLTVFNGSGMEEIGFQIKDMLPNLFGGGRTKRKQFPIGEALGRIQQEEEQKMIDMDQVMKVALERVENSGIVFLDEIDKIAGGGRQGSGPDVSRQGVQRDLLPLIEGCTVNTKYGMVKTDHILFIAAGAFHVAKVSDLLPELQGRLPIQVNLDSLTEEDFYRILVEPRNSLIKQNTALLETEEVEIRFTEDALREISRIAFEANESQENIGARRLHAVMEKVLEDLFYEASEMPGQGVEIDRDYVLKQIGDVTGNDMKKYIL
ncbi:ATP-dependent protease ATPase subunit HslU [Sulfidibacter corallicola]|uniref:ATP-dependent protease ATPase subunit HslU n=1 Tax=Sulfidibacter corallicola TaxID=2818388 RepID=A0A8A4TRP3_SULCO|nr:ATP-dependent protease ATPase subunit HslU [Sulfidibacter corallicola]QTD52626.1 ATP-dependent protease ATPase subunit HslU [Sulfidibacter corallicola]